MSDSPILFSYEIKNSGQGIPLEGEAVTRKVKSNDLAWVHLNANHPQTAKWLNDNVSYLDEIVINALLADETRPRLIEHKDGVIVILRGVNLNENAEVHDMISIRIWIDPYRIVSLQKRNLKAVKDLRHALENGNGPKDSADFIVSLSARLFQKMEPVIQELDERTDALEECILETPNLSARHDIIDVRKKTIVLRRYISPQKDVMATLRLLDLPWLDEVHKRRLQENLDHVTRYVEDLDAIRERAQIVKDELANILADKTNKNMYVLSLVAAVFLPLSFITGLLGINVGGLPGANYDGAFWMVCAICLTLMCGIIGLFRILKWL